MAIIIQGKTECVLCQRVLKEDDAIIATSHFIADRSHPLWGFSDAAMHRECFLHWPQRQEFVNLFNATLSPITFHDGTYLEMKNDGEVISRHRSPDEGPMPRIVLVIDDRFGEVEGLLYALRDQGIRAMYASSGAQGLEMAREVLPHMILCDLRMPNMTGHEFLEKVSLDPSLRQIPVLLLDADWVMDQDAINAWSKPTPSGRAAFAHWIKPLNVAECVAGIKALLPRLDRTAGMHQLGEDG